MKDLDNIQFITANFTQLKGLQASIIGLLLIGTTLWADKNQGNLSLAVLMAVFAVILWVIVERHYKNHFGNVVPKPGSRKVEVIIALIFMLIGLGAFILDTYELIPVSFLGITFAVATMVDYLRMNLKWRQSFFSFLPFFSIALFIVSLLPILGMDQLWQQLGFRSAITGVLTLVGFLVLFSGLLNHYYLVKSFPAVQEEN